MKGLTICQPYAELIASGLKWVENRRWGTSYRGPLAIHAGKNRDWLKTYEPLPPQMDFGAIVAVANLLAVVPLTSLKRLTPSRRIAFNPLTARDVLHHPHTQGPWCFVLQNVRRLVSPIPFPGKQGLWDLSLEAIDDVRTVPATTRPGHCRVCGCTDAVACDGGCWWIEPNLCTRCIGKKSPVPT